MSITRQRSAPVPAPQSGAAGTPARVAAVRRRPAVAAPRGGGDVLDAHFRPFGGTSVGLSGPLSNVPGYFRYRGTTGYGRCAGALPSPHPGAAPALAPGEAGALPFDLTEVVENLRRERYQQRSPSLFGTVAGSEVIRSAYYAVRPLLGVGFRKHLQRLRLRDWRRIAFPSWPVDTSVDDLLEQGLYEEMQRRQVRELPFVWYWPEGAPGALVMTHDVESAAGAARCDAIMDLDDARGIKASFQIVPETHVDRGGLLERIRRRGFGLNVHDFNHDGELFRSYARFRSRAPEIARHAREMGCRGFRSGSMYRRQEWFGELGIAYDMSVPNGAHLEPQRGGCCTVHPYFVGGVLELPLTTTQDYSLFHILGDYSLDLWQAQARRVLARHGLLSFIVHPDYVGEPRARAVFEDLLDWLSRLREETGVWAALPDEIESWWRLRSRMSVVRRPDGWVVEGRGSERARVAWAVREGSRLTYRIAEQGAVRCSRPAIA